MSQTQLPILSPQCACPIVCSSLIKATAPFQLLQSKAPTLFLNFSPLQPTLNSKVISLSSTFQIFQSTNSCYHLNHTVILDWATWIVAKAFLHPCILHYSSAIYSHHSSPMIMLEIYTRGYELNLQPSCQFTRWSPYPKYLKKWLYVEIGYQKCNYLSNDRGRPKPILLVSL